MYEYYKHMNRRRIVMILCLNAMPVAYGTVFNRVRSVIIFDFDQLQFSRQELSIAP